jgi:membrane protease YdiL (CAAX protease family)
VATSLRAPRAPKTSKTVKTGSTAPIAAGPVTDGEQPSKNSSAATRGAVSAVLVTIFLYLFGQLLGGFVASIYPRLKGWSYDQRINWLTNTIIGQFWYVLVVEAITLGTLFLYLKNRGGSRAQLGLTKPRLIDIPYAIFGFIAYIVALEVAVVAIVKPLFPSINITQHQDVGFSTVTSHRDLMLAFISLVVLPPIVEEIVFRGFLFNGLKRAMPVVWAGIATSLLFAAPHLLESDNGRLLWIAGIDTFILSIVLVYVRQKTSRLYAGMLIHGVKNYIAFAYLYHAFIIFR